MPGSVEIIVIFVLVLLLLGPDKLPELVRNIGKSLRVIRSSETPGAGEFFVLLSLVLLFFGPVLMLEFMKNHWPG